MVRSSLRSLNTRRRFDWVRTVVTLSVLLTPRVEQIVPLHLLKVSPIDPGVGAVVLLAVDTVWHGGQDRGGNIGNFHVGGRVHSRSGAFHGCWDCQGWRRGHSELSHCCSWSRRGSRNGLRGLMEGTFFF